MVAVLGAVGEADAPVLRRMQSHTATPLAIALDVEAWAGHGGSSSAAPLLAAQGWRAVALGPQDPLDPAWQQLGNRVTTGVGR